MLTFLLVTFGIGLAVVIGIATLITGLLGGGLVSFIVILIAGPWLIRMIIKRLTKTQEVIKIVYVEKKDEKEAEA